MRLATTKGIEVALLSRLESNLDLDKLNVIMDKIAQEPEQGTNLMRLMRFLLNPCYTDICNEHSLPGQPVLYGSLWECVFRNFGKGLFVATFGTTVLDALPILLRGRVKQAIQSAFLPIHFLHGLSFGLFVSVFNSTLYLVSVGSPGEMESARRRYGWLAGLMAGASVAIAPRSTREFTAKLTFTRSLEVLCKLVYRRLPRVYQTALERIGLSNHLDTLCMIGSSAVVLEDFIRGGQNLAPAYRSFLKVHGGLKPQHLEIVSLQMTKPDQPHACSLLHPEHPSCSKYSLNFLVRAFTRRSLPIYLRVFAVPLILRLVQGRHPVKSIANFGTGVIQSSFFLALYCTVAWSSVCMTADLPDPLRLKLRPLLTGLMSGGSLLVEKKSRRIEIALYVLSHALYVLMSKLERKRGSKFPNHSETLVAMLCCGFLLHIYLQDSDVIRPGYRFLLERFLDSRTQRHCTIIPDIISSKIDLV